LDALLAQREFAAGDAFTLADCALFPPLFYLRAIHRWEQPHITRYYRELLTRPAVARVVEEARPYRENFPHPWPADQDEVRRASRGSPGGGQPARRAGARPSSRSRGPA